MTILLPFALILERTVDSNSFESEPPLIVFKQILSRLFPFERGLVHDYWAGNVWALYMGLRKILKSMHVLQVPADFPPIYVALILLAGLLGGALYAWKAAAERSNRTLLFSFVYTGLASFQLAYHVHEKAIMTTLLPMIILPHCCNQNTMTSNQKQNNTLSLLLEPRGLLLEITIWGLLGLFPLIFEPRELLLKLVSFSLYSAWLFWVFMQNQQEVKLLPGVYARWLTLSLIIVFLVVAVLEAIPISIWGRFAFAPLALTSIACAVGLLQASIRLTFSMFCR